MRVGDNPNKVNIKQAKRYTHQVIVPVYIPNEEGYFKDSFTIFKLCLESLITTTNTETYITIVDNGSFDLVRNYLDVFLNEGKIHEVIHTKNIGKINAVLKGLVGIDAEIVTVSDQDILFKANWQKDTFEVFNNFPKAGVVGIIPMFNSHRNYCENIIFDLLTSKKLRFTNVFNPNEMIKFYDSIWTDRNYNQNYLKKILTLKSKNGVVAVVGSGHVVASFKKSIFYNIKPSFTTDLLSSDSDKYLFDIPPIKLGFYRLTTNDNNAYHMGNSYEPWMDDCFPKSNINNDADFTILNTSKYRKPTFYMNLKYYLKYYFVKKIVFKSIFYKKFLKMKSLENNLINHF